MGARATITIYQENQATPLTLYTHWTGGEISHTLADGLRKAKEAGRLTDSPYATRIIFDTLTGLEGGTTGFGIIVGDWDDINYTSPTVTFRHNAEPLVTYGDVSCSASQWIELFASSDTSGITVVV